MEAIGLLATKGVAALGVGATGSSGLGLSTLGTIFGGAAKFIGAQHQASVLRRQAVIEEENARRVREAGRRRAQDKDQEAVLAIGQAEAKMGASGLSLNSPGFLRRAARNKFLAQRDRLRIVEDADRESDSLYESAASNRKAASAAKLSGIFGLIGTGLGLGENLITSATYTNSINARRFNRNARNIR